MVCETTYIFQLFNELSAFAFGTRSGCRFLTVDAYADVVDFYESRCGFKFFTETDVNDDTRLMYFDLKPFKDAQEAAKQQA